MLRKTKLFNIFYPVSNFENMNILNVLQYKTYRQCDAKRALAFQMSVHFNIKNLY